MGGKIRLNVLSLGVLFERFCGEVDIVCVQEGFMPGNRI